MEIKQRDRIHRSLTIFRTDTDGSYFFLWEEQNFDFPLAEFLHAFPSFVFAAHLTTFAFGALFAFEAHFDFGLHAMFSPPSMIKS